MIFIIILIFKSTLVYPEIYARALSKASSFPNSFINSFALSLNKLRISLLTLVRASLISLIDAFMMSEILNVITCRLRSSYFFEFYFSSFFNLINQVKLFVSVESDAGSCSAGSGGSTCSVDIIIDVFRRVQLYYQVYK
jgi:hypothetical protein